MIESANFVAPAHAWRELITALVSDWLGARVVRRSLVMDPRHAAVMQRMLAGLIAARPAVSVVIEAVFWEICQRTEG